jgi:hypothetical protein
LVSKPLVEISGTEVMMWFSKIYCRMVRTRQGAVTNSSPVRRREYDSLDGNEAKGDPLIDTASHLLAASAYSERRELGGHQNDPTPHWEEVLLLRATGGQGPEDRPPPIAPTTTPNPCSDPAFLEQLVKAVVAGMAVGTSNPTPQIKRMVTLVKWVKGMWEISYTTYLGEEDAEVAGH